MTALADSATISLNRFTILLLVISLVTSFQSRNYLTSAIMKLMIHNMQLILYLAILQFNLPSNLTSFNKVFVSTISYDILDTIIDWERQDVLDFDYERHQEKINQLPD